MYNYWLVQIRLHEAVALLEELLNDEFQFTISSPHQWRDTLEELVDSIYLNDILITAGLNRYKIVPQLDGLGLVVRLDLVEKI